MLVIESFCRVVPFSFMITVPASVMLLFKVKRAENGTAARGDHRTRRQPSQCRGWIRRP